MVGHLSYIWLYDIIFLFQKVERGLQMTESIELTQKDIKLLQR